MHTYKPTCLAGFKAKGKERAKLWVLPPPTSLSSVSGLRNSRVPATWRPLGIQDQAGAGGALMHQDTDQHLPGLWPGRHSRALCAWQV